MKIDPIKNEGGYRRVLKEIEALMDAKPNTPAGDRLDVLVTWPKRGKKSIMRLNHPTQFMRLSSRWSSAD